MSTVAVDPPAVRAVSATISDDSLAVDLADGRTVIVPLVWYPRLLAGTPDERRNYRLIGQGIGIHWPDLDEDISIANILAGQPSSESQSSLARWLAQRNTPHAAG